MKETKERVFYDLTYPQKSIVTTEQYFNNPHISTISGYVVIKDSVNFDLLHEAVCIFINNHDALKIKFENKGNEIKQYFDLDEEPSVDDITVDSLDALVEKLNSVTFELFNSKLYYATTFKTTDGYKGYAFTVHHAITDAWSETIIISQINQIYDALLHGKPADNFSKTSYLEIIDQENHYLFSDKFSKDKEYWEDQYKEAVEVPNIRGTHKFDVEAKRILYDIPKKYYDFCTETKMSPFALFLASIFTYFSRIYNNKNLIIGTPVLNRTNFQAKSIFGMFISTQGFKQSIDDNITVKSFIENVASNQFSLLRHQKYPFELLQKYYGDNFGREHNLYDILYSYQNARVDTDTKVSFEYESKWVFSGAQADCLDISIFDIDNTGTLQLGYDYLTAIYTEKDIEDIHNRLIYILDQMIQNPNMLLKDIEIVTEKEKKILTKDFNNFSKKYDVNSTISTLFEDVVSKTPNNVALVYDGKEMTYKELNARANYLAKLLRENNIKNNDIVGIMTYRSFEMIIAQLAILKCGGAYLPIDPAYPEERISYILEDSKCPLLLTTSQIKTDNIKTPTFNIDLDTIELEETNLKNINKPQDLAYVIYTSGSTGKPKGVAIEHYGIVNTLLWRKEYYKFDDSFITLQIPSFSFDSSVEDIFTSLISGSKLIILKQNNTNFNLPLISELIKTQKVSHMLIVPSFYNILLNELADSLKNAKIFTVAGEGFSEELVKKHFDLLPNVRLVNEYGPTENSVCSTFYEFDKNHTKIFIGKPVTNCSCYVLNPDLKLQPFGVRGELYVAGPGLSRGYIGREDLTKERFIYNPFFDSSFSEIYPKDFDAPRKILMYKTGDICIQNEDGNLTFCERADFQIKYNGYRINLGEIESVLSKVSKTPNTACVLKNTNTKASLVAYIESKNLNSSDLHIIKKELSKYLPHYMVPNEIYAIPKFPATPNGKIDRKALESFEISKEKEKVVPPRNNLDQTILDIWKQVLGKDEISIDKSIFDLGGDSLTIISIQSILYKNNIHTGVQDLFENPTIKELSDFISSSCEKHSTNAKEKAFVRLYKDDGKDIKSPTKDYPDTVLLLGVTGFLGAHILDELMCIDKVKNIYCIIRNQPDKTPVHRLEDILDYYFDGKWKMEIGNRIHVLDGDLAREKLGLNPTEYSDLSIKVKSIFNSASVVKHFGDYDLFYNANVLSVEHLIEFAKKAHCPINHISTTSVSGNYLVKNDITYNYTENDFYIGQNYQDNVYVHSKFEQEALLFKAQQENVNVNIYRVGNIMPRISDGKFQINAFDNAYYKRIFGFIKLGMLPENLKTQFLEFTPVDILAQAIVKLSRYDNKVFHLLNDKTITIDRLIDVLKEYDKNIQFISEKSFEKNIKENTSNEILESFITDLDYKDNLDYTTNITMSNSLTNKYLEAVGICWPDITDEYIKRFIESML